MAFVDEGTLRVGHSPPPKPTSMFTQPLDQFIAGAAIAALAGTQAVSKSYPALAREVSANVIGPSVALGRGQVRVSPTMGALLLMPQPLGLLPPEMFGMRANYLSNINPNLRKIGLGGIQLPESAILKTLPDTDPAVKYSRYRVLAGEQRYALEKELIDSPIGTVIALYDLALSNSASRYFYDPAEIQISLEATLRMRLGNTEALRLAELSRTVGRHRYSLPVGGSALGPVPSPLGSDDPLARAGVSDEPPVARPGVPEQEPTTLAQHTATQAPRYLRGLASGRRDP